MNSECQAYSVIDARLHAVGRIGAAVEVLGEQLLALGVLAGSRRAAGRTARGEMASLLSHQTSSVGRLVAHDELVLRRAAGVDARVGEERAAGGSAAPRCGAAIPRRARALRGSRRRAEVAEAECLGAVRAVEDAELSHTPSPICSSRPAPSASLSFRRTGTTGPCSSRIASSRTARSIGRGAGAVMKARLQPSIVRRAAHCRARG